MSADVRELVVFIASPSDLPEEREAIRRAAEDVNASFARFGVRLQVVGWENVQPGFGRPQELINPLVDQCDVFVGFLKRRWGSDTGVYSSGFEEEFQRAKNRRISGELPTIAIFFGRIPDDSLADPGPELAKVLAFKRKLQDEHIALYRQFESTVDLERQLTSFFSSITAEVVYQRLPQAPQGATSTVAPTIPDPAASIDSALKQVGDTLLAFANLAFHGEQGKGLDSDRLLSFSLAIHRDEQLLPTQTANRLYLKANKLSLTNPEYHMWIRTIAGDIGRADSTGWSRTIPGWRIITNSTQIDTHELSKLIAELGRDQDPSVARGAFIILRHLNERPPSLWDYTDVLLNSQEQQTDDSAAKNSVTDHWDKIFRENRVPESVFAYIAEVASDGDLPLLDALAIQLEGSRASIEIMGLRDYVAGNPNTLAALTAQKYSVSSWEEEAILAVIDDLDQDVLQQLITGHHKSDKIRASALETAARDGHLAAEALKYVLATEDSELHDIIFRYSSTVGVEALRGIIAELEDASLKSDLKIRLLATSMNSDEIKLIMDQPVIGVDAWEALALQGNATFADLAREIFDTDAASLIVVLSDLEEGEQKEKLIDYLSARSRRSALYLLMHLPETERTDGDIDRARAELQRDHWLTRYSAASAVAALGTPEDAQTIVEAAQNSYPDKRRLALLKAGINLGGKDFAIKLASSDDMRLAKLATESLIQLEGAKDVELTELLYSTHAPVRIVALAGLCDRWDTDRLAKLLDEYPKQRNGYYYYNVVAELDRLVYAPGRAAETPINVPLA